MKTWCHLPTIIGRRNVMRVAGLLALCVALTTTLLFAHTSHAAADINRTINFQGRLLDATGGVVPDGYYNIQFKIYQDGDGLSAGDTTGSPAGTLKWTESYINNNVTVPNPTGVRVVNGYLSVNLGTNNPFGSSVDWNQNNLWLSMNVAGTAGACTTYGTAPCAADGEMLPMRKLTASPYSLNSGALNGLTSQNFVQLTQGVQTDAANGSSIFIKKTGTGNLIQFQNASTVDIFTVGNTGDLTFGNNANHTLSVATAGASTNGNTLSIIAGAGGAGTGNAGGVLTLQGGAAGGTNANGGDINLTGGLGAGTGVQGQVKIGAGGFTASGSTAQHLNANATVTGIDSNSTVYIDNNTTASVAGGWVATIPAPTNKYTGRLLYIQVGGILGTAPNNVINIAPNGASSFSMNANSVVALVWNTDINAGAGGWLNAGSSSSSGSFIQNQNAIDQSGANFRIAGTGQATGGFLAPSLDVASAGALNIGSNVTTLASTIQIGATGALASGGTVQTVTLGGLNNTGTQNVVVGATGNASGGTTKIQSKGNTTISTSDGGSNLIARATFDSGSTNGTLYLGNGPTVTTATAFTVQGSNGGTNNINGSALTIKGGTAGTGGNNTGGAVTIQGGSGGAATNGTGGDVTLQGGAATGSGVQGQLLLGVGGFTASTVQHLTATGPTDATGLNTNSTVYVDSTLVGAVAGLSIPAPANASYNGRILYVQIGAIAAVAPNNYINVTPIGGSAIKMYAKTSLTLIWNKDINGGAGGWLNSGADTGSGSYIQNQNTTDQTADFRISGVGRANTGFLGPSLDVATSGALSIGSNTTTLATSIQLGATTALASGVTAQTITIGGLNATGTQNVTVGSASGATAGNTTIQAKDNAYVVTNGANRAQFDAFNNLYFGAFSTASTFNIYGAGGGAANVAGNALSVQGGAGGTGGTGNTGGLLTLQGGNGAGTNGGAGGLTLDAGTVTGTGTRGTVAIGNVNAGTINIATASVASINIGSNSASAGTQAIIIGNNSAGATQNVTLGSASGANTASTTTVQSGGSTAIKSVSNTTIATNGTTRATFDTTGNLYLGDGINSSGTGTFNIQGSTGANNNTGYAINLQGGTGGGATGNGGNILIDGGAKGTSGGTNGAINIGTANASNITIGNATNTFTTSIQAANNITFGVNGVTRAALDGNNVLYLGNGSISTAPNDFTVQSTWSSTAGVAGAALTLQAGNVFGAISANGGALNLQSGNKGSAGGTDGTINLGTANSAAITIGGTNVATGTTQTIGIGNNSGAGTANVSIGAGTSGNTIQIGSNTVASGKTQNVNVGNNNGAGTTNVVVGSGSQQASGLSGGATAIQSKGNTTISTNGTTRATFDTGTNLYLGTGVTGAAGSYVIQGTGGTAGVAGSSLSIQGGAAGTGAVNGGDLNLSGGASAGGVSGQVKLTTSGFTTATAQNFAASGSVTQANVDNFSSIEISSTGTGPWTATVPAPTTKYNGRLLYIQISTIGSPATSITLTPTGGTTITMNPSTAVTLVWNTTVNAGAGGWLNAGADGGSNNYIQNQTGSVQTAGFKINGVGTADSFVTSASKGLDVATAGSLLLGDSVATTVNIGTATDIARTINIGKSGSTTAQTIGIGSAGSTSTTTIQGGVNGTTPTVSIQAATNGYIALGTTAANTINIGTLASAGTTNVTIGSAGGATAGATTIQSKNNTVIKTDNGSGTLVDRVTVGSGASNGTLSVGNGATNATPVTLFTVQATSNSGTGAGTNLTVQAGNSGSAANGANLTLSGGTGGNGVNGLVVLSTPTFQTYNNGAVYSCSAGPCNVPQASVDNNSVVVVKATNTGLTLILPNPSISGSSAYGRVLYVTGAGDVGAQNFTLSINGGGSVSNLISMRANSSATLVWGPGVSGAGAWTAAGASSSTTLQAAYDNTIQSSGGAELIVSKTSNTNGLTIRDSATSSVNGALLSVQSNTAANLISVSSNVTEYSQNSGAELYDTTTPNLNAFPNSVWSNASMANSTIARSTAAGTVATGQGSVSVAISPAAASTGVRNTLSSQLNTGLTYNVSFSALLSGSGSFKDMTVDYSTDGTAANATTNCAANQQIYTQSWTKVTCAFTVPAGANASNAIFIRQVASATRTFYVDNLSVTTSAGQSYVTDGGVDSALTASSWSAVGGSATQSTSNGFDASDSAQVTTTASSTSGIRNKLAVSPLATTGTTTYQYRVTTYVQTTASALSLFKIRYSRDGGTSFVDCVDYNQQTVAISTTSWQKITCIITTDSTAPTSPYLYFEQGDTTVRTNTLYIDTLSMTLANSTTPDVQIGSGKNGGPTTLFTLDSGTAPPIAGDNQSLLGSMYYDTSIGKIQCYQAAGWGSCGSAPDTVVTISPEYTNAVFHGTGVGTLTSDFCSGQTGIDINDGSSGQPLICSSTETYNFYKWTTPQSATPQSYSVYVTYQLPSTFKSFSSGSTSLKGRVDNTTNSQISYSVYKSNGSGLTLCGTVNVATAAGVGANIWDPGAATGTADPSTCSFAASNSIVFKINLTAKANSNTYISNIGFSFSNR